MSKSKISWTDYTWNPMKGCTKVSDGCVNCYAEKAAHRMEKNPNFETYRNEFKFTILPHVVDKPLSLRTPQLIFLCSMSDVFHEDSPFDYIQMVFDRMERCPHHIFQVLTKRPQRMAKLSSKLPWPDHIWAGATIEKASYLNRLDHLKKVPAKVRFVSFEPLLAPIGNIDFEGIHWAIVGGESGKNARPMTLDWARDIREQCRKAWIPFFFKQVGGKDRAKGGNLLDGREWKEFPFVPHPAVWAKIGQIYRAGKEGEQDAKDASATT